MGFLSFSFNQITNKRFIRKYYRSREGVKPGEFKNIIFKLRREELDFI